MPSSAAICSVHMSTWSLHTRALKKSAMLLVPLQSQVQGAWMSCHIHKDVQSSEPLGGLTSWVSQSLLIPKSPSCEVAAQ